ncbi:MULTISPECIES: S41 family peptidase [Niastella]|uniref:Tail specific protease domain-containing protein n=1 Tax=Niastella soli TaxID=2821487 RepID=A0ABS3YWV5_9BACT|nr:S41 family peptidase [Niastella soli]MBO9202402.1 hypothetical protein [Niastella soli]
MRILFLLLICLPVTLLANGSQTAGLFSTSKENRTTDTATNSLTPYQISSLQVLGEVWGFLKYYHPGVAKGQFNWDSVLIAKVPVFLAAENARQLDEVMLTWLNELGNVAPCTQCDNTLTGRLSWNLDTAWITHSGFNSLLVNKLQYILANRNQGDNHYVTYGASSQIKVINEERYVNSEYQFQPTAYRLLALFRYWNIVNYFSPYKYLTSQKWEWVLHELIPSFYQAGDNTQYQRCIYKMITALEDGHNAIGGIGGLPQVAYFFGEYRYLPFLCSIVEGKAVVTLITNDSLCKLQGIALHDVIVAIDGETIEERISKRLPDVYSASNREAALQELCFSRLFAGRTITCTITKLTAQGNTSQVVINRYNHSLPWTTPPAPKWKMVADNIAYIDMDQLLPREVNKIMDSLNATRGIIIDLRNHPLDVWKPMAARLCSHKFLMARLAYPDLSFPGLYKYFPDYLEGVENNTPYQGKVILLVNVFSKSAGEYSAMGLQAATKAITIGNTTAGADGNITDWIALPGGLTTRFSGLGIYYPDGTVAQKKGVKIDIVCKPTINGALQGKDELIETAIKVIMQQ